MQKSIFITGAGAGIGAAVAQHFLSNGWKVGIYDINQDAVIEIAQGFPTEQVRTGVLDVTNIEHWKIALCDFFQWAGRLDILCNNAGILYSGAFEQVDLEKHVRTFTVNVQGIMNGCHSALPYLKQTKNSRVINMSSASAIYGQADLSSYSASKFAIRGLTEALDIEWQKYAIRVIDIMPLFVKTDMVSNMDAGSIRKLGVHLTPVQVADVIYQAATTKSPKTHWPVGMMAKMMYHLSAITPDYLTRKVNHYISRH